MSAELDLYCDLLYGAEPAGSFAELRWRLRDGHMGREFVGLGDRRRLAAMIVARGRTTDLFVGVAPRVRQEGGRDAVERCHAVFVDCDSPESIEALERFDPAPSLVVASGRGVHGYWSIFPPLSPDWLERANRRVAFAVGADMRATDAARILRPPSTTNWKTGSPRPVELERMTGEVYEARAIVDGLPDPPGRAEPERRAHTVELDPGDPIRAVPLPAAFEILTGEAVPRSGMVRCPSADHEDRTPSCHVEDEVFFCHGCCRGGSLIDLGALLWEIEPRGAGYREIRRRLEAELVPALRRAA